MTYLTCPRNRLIIGPDEKELLARAAARKDGFMAAELWIKAHCDVE